MINYMEKTLEYYSMWLGQERVLNQDINDVNFIYFKERNETQYGYGQSFDIYIFCYEDKRIISYGDKAKEKLEELKRGMNQGQSIEKIKALVKDIYGKDVYPINSTDYNYSEARTKEEVSKLFTCTILIEVLKETRMERVRESSKQKFEDRMLPGGDLYEKEEKLLKIVDGNY